jgi:hypothetical protein
MTAGPMERAFRAASWAEEGVAGSAGAGAAGAPRDPDFGAAFGADLPAG